MESKVNENEWKYVIEAGRTLGGESEVPPEMRNRNFLEVMRSMTEGYVSTAAIIAESRRKELPFWRRNATVQQFMDAARQKAFQVFREAELWIETDLFKLARNGTSQDVHIAIERGADPNGRNEKGWTPLMCAAGFNEKPEVVSTLLQVGADINARVAYEPMMLIQYAPDVGSETILVDRSNCWTPLMCAVVFNKNPRIIECLITAGVGVNDRDNYGRSLQREPAQTNVKVSTGRTVLMLAAEHTTCPEIISVLINAGADVLARDGSGWTALMHAAQSNSNEEVINSLLTAGAEVNAENVFGGTALKIALDFNQKGQGVIAALIKAGARPTGGLQNRST